MAEPRWSKRKSKMESGWAGEWHGDDSGKAMEDYAHVAVDVEDVARNPGAHRARYGLADPAGAIAARSLSERDIAEVVKNLNRTTASGECFKLLTSVFMVRETINQIDEKHKIVHFFAARVGGQAYVWKSQQRWTGLVPLLYHMAGRRLDAPIPATSPTATALDVLYSFNNKVKQREVFGHVMLALEQKVDPMGAARKAAAAPGPGPGPGRGRARDAELEERGYAPLAWGGWSDDGGDDDGGGGGGGSGGDSGAGEQAASKADTGEHCAAVSAASRPPSSRGRGAGGGGQGGGGQGGGGAAGGRRAGDKKRDGSHLLLERMDNVRLRVSDTGGFLRVSGCDADQGQSMYTAVFNRETGDCVVYKPVAYAKLDVAGLAKEIGAAPERITTHGCVMNRAKGELTVVLA